MRLRRTLKAITWSAAAIALTVLIWGGEKHYVWIGIIVPAAVFLHFFIETIVILKRRRFRHRLADVRQYGEHHQFQVKDLEAALSDDTMMAGVSVPVILTGTLSGGAEHQAPLSKRNALAWRVVAEPIEAMGKIGGQVIVVDSHWDAMSLSDETGKVGLGGPGVLDGSSLRERIFMMKNLHAELPQIASRVEDALGLAEAKDSKNVRVELREIAVFAADKVVVYGKAHRSSGKLEVTGNDTVEDPESLLVQAVTSPASSRIPRRTMALIGAGTLAVCALVALGAVVYSAFVSRLFQPGGMFDPTRTAAVRLDLDGRPLRVMIAKNHWTFDKGDLTKGFALSDGTESFRASRGSPVVIQRIEESSRVVLNGEHEYPRWDGAAWILEIAPSASPNPTVAAASRAGRLYVRNRSDSSVKLRLIKGDETPLGDTVWNFAAHEGAQDPRGSYLIVLGKGPISVSSENMLELITTNGSRRILALAEVAKWREAGSWLFEIVPEYLAGEGKLYVKNRSDNPVSLWILGADNKPLYGEAPWTFEPQEGNKEDKGLRLQYEEKDIVFSGRESVRVATQSLHTLYSGTLEQVATLKDGAWTIDLGEVGK